MQQQKLLAWHELNQQSDLYVTQSLVDIMNCQSARIGIESHTQHDLNRFLMLMGDLHTVVRRICVTKVTNAATQKPYHTRATRLIDKPRPLAASQREKGNESCDH